MMYHPPAAGIEKAEWAGEAPRPVQAMTADGLALRGYVFGNSETARDVIVFYPGNADGPEGAAKMASPLAATGAVVLSASYRGYGANPGRPTEAGLYKDGAAFLKLARQIAPSARVWLFGYSLGSAVALKTAENRAVPGVFTLGAFCRITHLTSKVLRAFVPDRFDNCGAAVRARVPIVAFHGTADEIVPLAEGELLRNAAPSFVQLVRLEGAPHRIALDPIAPPVARAMQAISARTASSSPVSENRSPERDSDR